MVVAQRRSTQRSPLSRSRSDQMGCSVNSVTDGRDASGCGAAAPIATAAAPRAWLGVGLGVG